MLDIRCTQCNYLFGKRMDIRYGEMKCPKCGAINVIDYQRDETLDKRDGPWYKKIRTK